MSVYTDYLKSRQWKNLRDRLIRYRALSHCELCSAPAERGRAGRPIGLNVHHLTYERLGHEHDEDLAVLCRSCHERLHELPRDTALRSLKAIRLATTFDVYKQLVTGNDVDVSNLDPSWCRRYGIEPA